MAYISQQQVPEEEKNQFGRTAQTTPNPIPPQTGGSAGTSAQGPGGTNAAPGVGTSTQFGSNAAKLSDYLKANESQVADFGNKVAGNLTQGYNQTIGNIDTGYGNFNNQVNQGYAQDNPEMINSALKNPFEFTKNPENIKSFQSLYNNEYKGPQNFESSDTYSNLNNDVNKAVENSSLVNNFSGLGTYLNNNMGTGGTTPGMQTLDTALLQRSPEASAAIKSAAAPYQGLNDYLGGKAGQANKNIANAKTQADKSKEDIRNAVVQTENTNKKNLEAGSTMPDWNNLIKAYGNSFPYPPQFTNPSVDLARYINATPEDYQNLSALNQLSGSNENPYLSPEIQKQLGSFDQYGELASIFKNMRNRG